MHYIVVSVVNITALNKDKLYEKKTKVCQWLEMYTYTKVHLKSKQKIWSKRINYSYLNVHFTNAYFFVFRAVKFQYIKVKSILSSVTLYNFTVHSDRTLHESGIHNSILLAVKGRFCKECSYMFTYLSSFRQRKVNGEFLFLKLSAVAQRHWMQR